MRARPERSPAPTPPSNRPSPSPRSSTPRLRDYSAPPRCLPDMYEDLAFIEERLEAVEINTLRKNYLASKQIYDDRANIISKIPHFWALVFEEAPEDIDCRIQPRDTAVLSTLKSFQITRFEVTGPDEGEPRSVKFTFTFDKNDWFHDEVLEKTFWYRKRKDGWTGLVSEPVKIQWKEGMDLTDGLLDMAVDVWADETQGSAKSPAQDTLVERMDNISMDAISLFAWFGYRGRKVSAQESSEAVREEEEKKVKGGPGGPLNDDDEEDDEGEPDLSSAIEQTIATEEDPADDELSYEIFPRGEELAIALSDDLYPSAIKYFTQGQEADAFDSGDEEVLDSDDEESDEPARKKAKRSS